MTTVHAVCNLLKRPLLTINITSHDFLYDLMNLVLDIALRVSVRTTHNFRWFFDKTLLLFSLQPPGMRWLWWKTPMYVLPLTPCPVWFITSSSVSWSRKIKAIGYVLVVGLSLLEPWFLVRIVSGLFSVNLSWTIVSPSGYQVHATKNSWRNFLLVRSPIVWSASTSECSPLKSSNYPNWTLQLDVVFGLATSAWMIPLQLYGIVSARLSAPPPWIRRRWIIHYFFVMSRNSHGIS